MKWRTMGTIVVTPSDRMERHLAVGGVSRSLRSNVRLEWILYRVRDETETIHRDVEQRTEQGLGATHNA